LEKDKKDKDSKKKEAIPPPFNGKNEVGFGFPMIEERYEEEKSRGDKIRGQGKKEDDDYQDSVFYACLEEILENENSKKDDTNNKDIRGFFHKEKEAKARESTKKLIPIEEVEDGLLSLWKNDNETPDNKIGVSGKMVIEKQQDLWGTSEKTPVRSLDNSFTKKVGTGNNSHTKSGGFRFSLQPKSRDSDGKLSQSFNSRPGSDGKNSKKRNIDVIDIELEKNNQHEEGITSNFLKKVKINTNMGRIIEGNDDDEFMDMRLFKYY